MMTGRSATASSSMTARMSAGSGAGRRIGQARGSKNRAGKLNNKIKIAVVDGGYADSTEYPPERTNYTATINALESKNLVRTLADLAGEEFTQGEIRRLEELRLDALEERIAADIELGLHREVTGAGIAR